MGCSNSKNAGQYGPSSHPGRGQYPAPYYGEYQARDQGYGAEAGGFDLSSLQGTVLKAQGEILQNPQAAQFVKLYVAELVAMGLERGAAGANPEVHEKAKKAASAKGSAEGATFEHFKRVTEKTPTVQNAIEEMTEQIPGPSMVKRKVAEEALEKFMDPACDAVLIAAAAADGGAALAADPSAAAATIGAVDPTGQAAPALAGVAAAAAAGGGLGAIAQDPAAAAGAMAMGAADQGQDWGATDYGAGAGGWGEEQFYGGAEQWGADPNAYGAEYGAGYQDYGAGEYGAYDVGAEYGAYDQGFY